jgi:hypothetical protein
VEGESIELFANRRREDVGEFGEEGEDSFDMFDVRGVVEGGC